MLKRDFFRKCALLVAAALLVVAISSCSQEKSLVLCNIKLDVEDASRSFDDVVFNTTLSSPSYTLYYSTVYKGSDKSCYGVFSNQEYDSKVGILLSQGRWEITCAWKDAYGNTVATGTTNDIWVNLNTSSFKVYLDENGKGSAKLNYEVFKAVVANVTNAVTDVKVELTLSKWNGSAFDVKNNVNGLEGTQGTEENSIKIYNQSFEDLDSGKYLLVIQTIDNTPQTSESILFTDVIGFVVKPGHTTVINGSCEVINGVSGKNEYITWEDDPKNPEGNTSTAGNESSGAQIDLTKGPINTNTIYVIQEDNSGSTDKSMTLGGYGKGNNETRVVVPEDNTNFGINMNGTDVVLSTYSGSYDITNNEKTTIVKLPTSTTMTLFNYVMNGESETANTWGLIPEKGFKRRYHANANVCGGTLNVVGPTGKDNSISNIPIVFQGPSCYDSNTFKSAAYNTFYKQGTINVSNPGGMIVLDGNVTVAGHTGISSWAAEDYVLSTIQNDTNTDIILKNGARIDSVGDYHTETVGKIFPVTVDYSDTAYGIKLTGDSTSTGSINIVLDNGYITTSNDDKSSVPADDQSILTDEACIYIENFNGNITINLTNNSSLISESGTAIKIVNCAGSSVELKIESGCVINSDIIIGSTTLQLTKDSDNRLTVPVDRTFTTL